TLLHLQGKAPIPIPELIAYDIRDDGWMYVVMTKLEGTMLENAWNECSHAEKADIMEQIGQLMAAIHSIPAELELTTWPDFIKKQVNNFFSRHSRQGMPQWFMSEVEAYVRNAIPLLPAEFIPVILTGEYTPFNLLVTRTKGKLTITGMIDFGDTMIGYHEY